MTPNGDDDDDLDDASLKSMRAVWLSMRDEEPPAAGMSALLAAAAHKAEQMRDESHPWWRRAFDMLRRPPALAFATVMILIGGAVLVTRTADKKTPAEVAGPAPALESRDVQMGSGAAGAPADNLDQKEAEKRPDVAPPPPPAIVEKPPAVKHGTKLAKPAKPTEQPKPEPNRYDRFEDGAAKIEAQKGQGGDISGTTLDSPGRVKAPRADKAPVLQQTPSVDSTSEAEMSPEPQQPATPIEQLARQAETAAARGDCAAVKAIVARIKQQDDAFFKSRLGKSAAVTKCL